MDRMNTAKFQEITFSDSDIVNLDDWIPLGESNPHNVRAFLLHDHGFVLAVCFADCLQDAIDIAADAQKLEQFLIADGDPDYSPADFESGSVSYVGNNSKPADLESLSAVELPNVARSFVAQFIAAFPS